MTFKTISLTRGFVTIVDHADYEWLNQWKWMYNPKGYAQREKNNTTINMHRFIMNTPNGMYTDHINGDGLDNRRRNLRICNSIENGRNRKKHKNSTSKFKGVYFGNGAWRASIRINKKLKDLGTFILELDAAKKYDEAAIEYFGEFAKLNFI